MSMQSPQQGNDDATLILILIVAFGLYFAVTYFQDDLKNVWRYMRLAELYPFAFIDFLPYLNTLGIERGVHWLQNVHPSQITTEQMTQFDNHYGVLRYPFAILPMYLGFKLFSRLERRNSTFNMEQLLSRMSTWPEFPWLKYFIVNSPEKESIDFNRLDDNSFENAVALNPYEFALLTPPLGLTEGDRPIFENGMLDKHLARRSFETQLGAAWRGKISELDTHERRIFDELMAMIIKSGFKANPLIKDKDAQKKDQKKTIYNELNKHAYVRTMIMTLLEMARGGGVVAALQFRWVKAEDRTLWYIISSVGRKTPFVEACGVFAQWSLEKEVGRAVPFIEVECAVEGLEFAIYGPPDPDDE